MTNILLFLVLLALVYLIYRIQKLTDFLEVIGENLMELLDKLKGKSK